MTWGQTKLVAGPVMCEFGGLLHIRGIGGKLVAHDLMDDVILPGRPGGGKLGP
jgi:hypothetical protein